MLALPKIGQAQLSAKYEKNSAKGGDFLRFTLEIRRFRYFGEFVGLTPEFVGLIPKFVGLT